MKTTLFDEILSLLELAPERQYDILDLGCGTGDLLARISGNVAPGSNLVGIDAMRRHIDHAKKSYPGVDFRQEKFVDSLPFSDAAFDVVVSVDALECIPNRTALVAEVARVLRPGGRILFAHWDWDTQVYHSEHREVVRRLVAEFSDWQQGWMDASDGQMGRRLWGVFEGSGLFTGFMESFTLLETEYEKGRYGFDRLQDLGALVATGRIGKTDYDMICDEMKALARNGEYFYSVNSYIYVGSKA